MSEYRVPLFVAAPGFRRFASAVDDERQAQLAKWGDQKHPDGTGGPVMRSQADEARAACQYLADNGGPDWRSILLEEVYEALAEEDLVKLRAELVQVAAVAAAWVRDIDTRPHPMLCAHCGEPIRTGTGLNTWYGPIPTPGQPDCTAPRYHLDPAYPECRKAGGAVGGDAE